MKHQISCSCAWVQYVGERNCMAYHLGSQVSSFGVQYQDGALSGKETANPPVFYVFTLCTVDGPEILCARRVEGGGIRAIQAQ